MFLLDTDIVSELRRARPHGGVLAWLRSVPNSDLFISAVTIGELQAGAEKMRKRASVRASQISAWIHQVIETNVILPMDAQAFQSWAVLMCGQPDHLSEDAMIAATALVHGLTVATRNVRDFAPLGVSVVNPFETSS